MSAIHPVLILIWIAIALLLRLTHLTTKPLWADEISTLAFSLGNGYRTIPLDQILSLNDLLHPLQPNPQATLQAVVQRLLTESNHPPLYFVLTHLWLKLFPTMDGFVSLWPARALSVGFSVATVPAMFGLGWFAFRSRLVGHVSALLMALSPFGIYLAQEARHYTLATLWIVASLSCLVAVAQCIQAQRPIPLWLCLLWIVSNGLGIATHYFVLFALVAEAIALLLWLALYPAKFHHPMEPQIPSRPGRSYVPRLVLVLGGTLATSGVWLPILSSIRGTELTRWIQAGEFDQSTWIDQVLRPVAGLITMLYLPPIQGIPNGVVLGMGGLLALLLLWTLPLLRRGWQHQAQKPATRSMLVLFSSFVGSAIALSLLLTLGLGINVSSVFRYQFFYHPAVIVLLGLALANYWNRRAPGVPGLKQVYLHGKCAIALVLLCSFLGSITVISNWGYQKTHRPDQVAAAIHASWRSPTLVAIPHRSHAHSGRLMAIAWELRRLNPTQANQTLFLLAHQPTSEVEPAIATLQTALQRLPRPLDVWRINFRSQANPLSHQVLQAAGCLPTMPLTSVDGYRYQRYECGNQ
ncbi:MAG: hypothetical protein NW220_17655 [Leptolyngbyaceae cyanobacterium bins.349]|nr:hypothetical protein [Leptolyngbyaceae cyanobacterium bins.349]